MVATKDDVFDFKSGDNKMPEFGRYDPSDLQISLIAWLASQGGKLDHKTFSEGNHHKKTIWSCEERGFIYANNTHYELTKLGIQTLGWAMNEATRSKAGSITEQLIDEVQYLKDQVQRLSKRVGVGI